jgi:hypothetical protein
MLTRQELFTNAVVGLAAQNWVKSSSSESPGDCLYRGPGGLKCAVGFSIPDESYTRDIEGMGAKKALLRAGEGVYLGHGSIWAFQQLHDRADSPEQMKQNFIDYGKEYYLKWPEGL